MSLAYYNEFDPFCADWLLELIADGLIAPGIVDRRSMVDVLPSDLKGFNQCHFFAGIGVWSLAARLAGWPDDRPLWTGSAPCQSFSAAGKGLGFADERHLWPAWFHLIECAKPAHVPLIGEQVASKDGRTWFDLVSSDMEGLGHACGALDTCAAGLGAPFIGQRLYWLAATNGARLEGHRQSGRVDAEAGREVAAGHCATAGTHDRMGAPDGTGLQQRREGSPTARYGCAADAAGADDRLGQASSATSERNAGAIHPAENQFDGSRVAVDGVEPERYTDASCDSGMAASENSGRQGDALRTGRLGSSGNSSDSLSDRLAASDSGECEHQSSEHRPDRLCGASHGATRLINGFGDNCTSDDNSPNTNGNSGIPLHPVEYWRDAEWLLCRDPNGPRFRPVESAHVIMVDVGAVGGYMASSSGESCQTARQEPKEIDDANVRSLRQDAGNENISALGAHGEHQHLREAALLQPAVHGGLAIRSDQGDEAAEQPQTVGEDAETELRKMRQDEQSDARSPSGRESIEQRAVECPDVVRFMSYALTLAELRRDNATAEALLALQQAILSKGAVLHPSDSIEAVWRSLSHADQERIRVDHSFERWVTVRHFPLTEKNTYVNRLNEIRGAGNALNVAQASTFIECVMEYLA